MIKLKLDAEAIWKAAEESKKDRAQKMPTEHHALLVISEAMHRLEDLGWRPAMYCPKDGSEFHVIEPGSTGIHVCQYIGDWQTGGYWIVDAGDLWPSKPILFKPLVTPVDKPPNPGGADAIDPKDGCITSIDENSQGIGNRSTDSDPEIRCNVGEPGCNCANETD